MVSVPREHSDAAPDESDAIVAAAYEFGLPALDLAAFDLASIPADLVDADLAKSRKVLPLARRGERLFVAIADPANLDALDDLKFRTGIEPQAVLVEADKLTTAIARYRPDHDTALLEQDDVPEDDELAAAATAAGSASEVDEAPVVKFVHKVLLDAVEAGASDIHFEPFERCCRIRLRIDGVLREMRRTPPALSARLAARLKVMAQMDIAERRLPQDGRIKLANDGAGIDFRASTLPTVYGEKVVLRILDASSARLGIDQLGFEREQRQRYVDALHRPQGMVLVTGPTGSGKTVTLYAGLNMLNAEHRNIATAEDPVEIHVDGINQVQVNSKVDLDFATALRAFLRQDPDVVMVGEIRDPETAETAVKAAQTGHLVLSTLHTNSATETLTRLRNIGVPAYNIATSVTLIVAQRLARRLCPHCKRPVAASAEALLAAGFAEADLDAGFQLFDAHDEGCADCSQGYRGRIGLHEVVEVVPPLQRLILAAGNSLALAEQARALGYEDLRRAGLKKAMRGLTSLREIGRVTAGDGL